jgi:site-specific DNA-methyltransferase (adenine-specific)
MESRILTGDCRVILKNINSASIQCIITSPPFYGLRDYFDGEGQIGLESDLKSYVSSLTEVFNECKRVLKPNGCFWLNLGDVYAQDRGGTAPPAQSNSKGNRKTMPSGYNPTRDCKKLGIPHKSLIGLPWRVALSLQEQGWVIRSDIIWEKPASRPEKVKDRPVRCHEYLFLFAKNEKYYFDHDKIINRSVWKVLPSRNKEGKHYATFPIDLITPCLLAGSQEGDLVLDPFSGSGTVGVACKKHNRNYIGIELNPEYVNFSEKRIKDS